MRRRTAAWMMVVFLLAAGAAYAEDGWECIDTPQGGAVTLCILPTEGDAVLEIVLPEGAARRFLRQGVMHFEVISVEQAWFRLQPLGNAANLRAGLLHCLRSSE